jgi:hypothetical protein
MVQWLEKYDLLSPIDSRDEQERVLAPRLSDLNGKVLGLLDNRKGNADHLLMRFGELLGEQYALKDIMFETKPIFSRPAPDDLLDKFASRCDVVLTAIGD